MILRICGCLAGALCLLAGCNSTDVESVPVAGTVTLDGKPLANKNVLFTPESGTGIGGSANTDTAGKYALLAIVPGATSDVKGVPSGRYKVTVVEPAIPSQGAEGDPAAEGVLVPGEAKASGGIPVKYQDPANTPLTVEVPEGGGTIDLELKSQ